MAERIAVEIEIGGKVAAALVPELCRVIVQTGAGLEYGSYDFRPTSADELLEARRGVDNLLLLIDDQARWGEFPELEAFLQEHNIPYTRRTEPTCMHDGELVQFRPGNEPVVLHANGAHEPIILASKLVEVDAALAQALEQFAKGPASFGSARKLVRTAQHRLRREMPPQIAPLEPFEIDTE